MAVPQIMKADARHILHPANEPGELIGKAERPVGLPIGTAGDQRLGSLPQTQRQELLGVGDLQPSSSAAAKAGRVTARVRPDLGGLNRIPSRVCSRLSIT